MKDFMANSALGVVTNDIANETEALASSVFRYPHLDQLLEKQNASSLAVRRRLEETREHLDRMVRSAKVEEADQAARVLRAYEVTISLIAELEQLRNVLKPSPGETLTFYNR